MRLGQRVRTDRMQAGAQGAAQLTGLHRRRQLPQDRPLLTAIRRLELGPGEHELPVEADALGLEQIEIERRPVAHDRHDRPLGPDQLRHHRPVGIGVAEVGDRVDLAQPQLGQLGHQGLAVIDHGIGAHRLAPGAALRPGGGGDHPQASPAGQLDRDRAHAAGAAEDQQAAPRVTAEGIQPQPLEQRLPGGEAGERQRRGLGRIQRCRPGPDDRLLHQHPFGAAAGSADVTREPDPIARSERRHRRAHRLHHSCGIPAQQPRRRSAGLASRRQRGPHLGVHRVDRQRLHPHQQVVRPGSGFGQNDRLEAGRVAAAAATPGRDRSHIRA